MPITEQIVVSLVSSVVGGVIVAIINQIFNVRKTNAEAEKLRAEAEKIRIETVVGAEKIAAEAEKIRIETAKMKAEFEKLNAFVDLNPEEVIVVMKGDKEIATMRETRLTIRKESQ